MHEILSSVVDLLITTIKNKIENLEICSSMMYTISYLLCLPCFRAVHQIALIYNQTTKIVNKLFMKQAVCNSTLFIITFLLFLPCFKAVHQIVLRVRKKRVIFVFPQQIIFVQPKIIGIINILWWMRLTFPARWRSAYISNTVDSSCSMYVNPYHFLGGRGVDSTAPLYFFLWGFKYVAPII